MAPVHGAPYIGRRYQSGHGVGAIFKHLVRAAIPAVASVGKSMGKELLRKGAETGVAIATDALAGRDIKTAAKRRVSKAAAQVLQKGMRQLAPAVRRPAVSQPVVSRPSGAKRARRTRRHAPKKKKTSKTSFRNRDIFTS